MPLWHSLRLAARMLGQRPGLTTVMVLALAVGICVNLFVFSAADVMLLRPLPVEKPEEVVDVFIGPRDQARVWGRLSYPEYVAVQEERDLFSGVIATTVDQFALSADEARTARIAERSEAVLGELVSGNYFDVLGVRPARGRTFSADESGISHSQPVLVISHSLWVRRFNSDPEVVGRTVHLNQMTFTIIGVMPPAFNGVVQRSGVEYWFPLGMRAALGMGDDWATDRHQRIVRVFGRLLPGQSIQQAQTRLNTLAETLGQQFPDTGAGMKVNVTSQIEGRYRATFDATKLGCALALFVSTLVLLISCANVASLQLARAAGRERELAVRRAIGASVAEIVGQLMIESMLVALLSGAVGAAMAFELADLLHAFLPPLPFQYDLSFEPSSHTVSWGLGATLVSGIAFGILPAWRGAKIDIATALKTDLPSEGQGMRRAGVRQALVVAQVAVSIVVLVAGGLVVRSLTNLERIDPGYRTQGLLSAQVDPGLFTDNEADVNLFFAELTRRLERLPGVRSVSSTLYMPLNDTSGSCGPILREGEPPPAPNQGLRVLFSVVQANYFATVGTELLEGRDFEPREHEGDTAVAIVNAQLARQLFGREQEAVGKRFRIGGPESPLVEVVGVARDGRYRSLLEAPRPWLYLPAAFPELHDGSTMRTLLLRVPGSDLRVVAEGLRAEVEELDARLPVQDLRFGDEHLRLVLFDARLAAELGMLLALIALGLAATGLYSLMAYSVSQRTKEIGIRMALGAQVTDVLRLVFAQGLRLVGLGVLIGSIAAFMVARVLTAQLYAVGLIDPFAYVGTVVLLVLAATLAIFIPARRATQVDPLVAIRYGTGA